MEKGKGEWELGRKEKKSEGSEEKGKGGREVRRMKTEKEGGGETGKGKMEVVRKGGLNRFTKCSRLRTPPKTQIKQTT